MDHATENANSRLGSSAFVFKFKYSLYGRLPLDITFRNRKNRNRIFWGDLANDPARTTALVPVHLHHTRLDVGVHVRMHLRMYYSMENVKTEQRAWMYVCMYVCICICMYKQVASGRTRVQRLQRQLKVLRPVLTNMGFRHLGAEFI